MVPGGGFELSRNPMKSLGSACGRRKNPTPVPTIQAAAMMWESDLVTGYRFPSGPAISVAVGLT